MNTYSIKRSFITKSSRNNAVCGGRIYTNHIKWKEVKKDMIYLDNSATTQVDKDVAMTACEVMTEVYGNPSSVSAWKGCAGAADSSQAGR